MMAPGPRDLLRFITCGSVDDGKSTLIGRLLHDMDALGTDQLATLEADSHRVGTQGKALDFALLLDGLAAEREQGITIDVAYRFFSTARRRFIVADTPGHEQFTRNMVTGASTADVAVILVDARKGVLRQTRRHAFIVSLLGVRRVVLAVNKMDLIGWDQARFDAIVDEFRAWAATLAFQEICAIPAAALTGENVAQAAESCQWYSGPTLLDYLDSVPAEEDVLADADFRLPVQLVLRPNAEFRGYAGLVASGRVGPGDAVRVIPSGRMATVARVLSPDRDVPQAQAGDSVTIVLDGETDVARGDVLAAADAPLEAADQFEATVVWMSDAAMLPERLYRFCLGPGQANARVTRLKHKVDVDTLQPLPAASLSLNEIGVCNISLDRQVPFEPYERLRDLGGGVLVDRASGDTVAAVLLHFPLRRASSISWQALDVTAERRGKLLAQRPMVLWFTGLSGAGKSTIANLVEQELHAAGRLTYLLDGDNVRHGLCRDLGFTPADRVENMRRIAEAARLMADAGLIVLVAAISPFQAERDAARALLPGGRFLEIFVDTSLQEVERRDVKGLYRRARAGEIPNFTGISSEYERPQSPDMHIDTMKESPREAASRIVGRVLAETAA